VGVISGHGKKKKRGFHKISGNITTNIREKGGFVVQKRNVKIRDWEPLREGDTVRVVTWKARGLRKKGGHKNSKKAHYNCSERVTSGE